MRTITVALLLTLLLVLYSSVQADIPRIISYQGKVTDSGGTPVADGAYTMRFRLYNASTGGSLRWDSGNRSIQVTGGIFNVLLGESPQPSITLEFDEDLWLLVTFSGSNQSPRVRLTSTSYAYMASGIVPGTEVSGSVTTGTLSAFKASNTAATGTRYGIYGLSASTYGRGVYGYATATTGANYGVYGKTLSPSGYAGFFDGNALVTGDLTVNGTIAGVGDITGVTAGTGLDGGGTSGSVTLYVETPFSLTDNEIYTGTITGINTSTGGWGVHGEATATTGITYGLAGTVHSPDGRALHGYAYSTTGTTYGLFATSLSSSGRGVYGKASSTTGSNFGVYGVSESTTGRGVYGYAYATTGMNYGVQGETRSTNGRAVHGYASATTGTTYGLFATSLSSSGKGVYGKAEATTGTNYGVYGVSESTSGRGVYGYAYATTGTNYGVYGETRSNSGYAGYFNGRLYALETINSTATPSNHVAMIRNSSTGTSPDVLALKVGYTGNPSNAINFITFFKGGDTAVGSIEGDGSGGITLRSGSGDFAEFLPKLHPGESLEPGDVVGVHAGQVSKRTQNASQHLVVSTRPIVLGNDPGEEEAEAYVRVAFIGQVAVNVRGEVKAGDLLIPSGNEDGTAIAVDQNEITAEQVGYVIGQALQSSHGADMQKVRASVGMSSKNSVLERMAGRIQELEARLEALEEPK